MTDLTKDIPQAALDAIQQERAGYFTRAWFGQLVSGRLTPGDTFWMGNYGALLFVVPAVVMLAYILRISTENAMAPVLGAIAGVVGLYRLAIARALTASSFSHQGPKGWRITGILWTLGEAAALFHTALKYL